ncbi:MAG: hypothetical protein ACLFNN_01015 [Candidatus Paceibacterota bacterium]
MDILEKLFGSPAKVRIMKLLLFHPGSVFDVKEICKRTQTTTDKARKEIRGLEKIGFLKRKKNAKEKNKLVCWGLNNDFPYIKHLQSMLVHTNPFAGRDIAKKFKNSGDIKLLIISGIFIQDWESRVDLMIVGDKLKRPALHSAIKTLEADMGRELRYTLLETEDFDYRMNIYDKLVRDVLDFPHEKILNKLNV